MTEAHVPIPTFGGRIGRTPAESEPCFAERPHPGEDAPNVVVVLLDDTGFAQFGCYGSDIDTASVDRLAANGLQFTNFHVTPLCSPTRAALLTGRSQHAVGMRTLANFNTGFPHQLGHISNHAATVAEVLRAEGYATFCAGKWHLGHTQDSSAAGPFDQWPLGRGFDRFYGFLEGETDQFHPELVIDNHRADPPAGPDEGYHLSEGLIDQLLLMISDSKGVRPDRPFFAYLPFGATHAPHQAPASLVVHWPDGIDAAERGTMRHQFVNVSDIVPTIYELLGVAPPDVFKGLEQMPITGHSFAPVMGDAEHPATNTLQYFEMAGSRALVSRSWKAVCRHIPGDDFDTEQWELYDLSVDASECDDLAAHQPDKLVELVELWWSEAGDHAILESSIEVPAGDSTLSVHLNRLSRTSGTLAIAIDGARCGRCDLPVFMGIVSSVGASIGRDHGSAVSDRYAGPFRFSGTLHEVEIRLTPEPPPTQPMRPAPRWPASDRLPASSGRV